MRKRFGASVGIACALACGATVALSAPGEHVPRSHTLSPRGQDVETFELAGNPRGDVAAAWIECCHGRPGLWLRSRRHGHRFARPQLLARTFVSSPALAVGDDGSAAVAWIELRRHARVVAMTRARYGSFGKPRVLARGADPDGDPTVAVGPEGTVMVAWTKGPQTGPFQLHAAVRSASRRWSHPHTVTHGKWSVVDPHVAIDADGDATLAWERENPNGSSQAAPFGGPGQIAIAERPAGGPFGRPRVVSQRGHDASDGVLAENARGDAVVAWDSFRDIPHLRVGYASRGAGDAFGPAKWLTPRSGFGGLPRAVVDADGRVNVAWSATVRRHGHLCDGCSVLRIARGPAGGRLTHQRRVAGAGASLVELAGNGARDSLAVWEVEKGDRLFQNRIEGRFVTRSGGLGPRRRLSDVGRHYDTGALLASNGRGIVAWVDADRPSRVRFVHVHE
jgi:hypothetical protein